MPRDGLQQMEAYAMRLLAKGCEVDPFAYAWTPRTLMISPLNQVPRHAWRQVLLDLARLPEVVGIGWGSSSWLTIGEAEGKKQSGLVLVSLRRDGTQRNTGCLYQLDETMLEGEPGHVYDIQPMPQDWEDAMHSPLLHDAMRAWNIPVEVES